MSQRHTDWFASNRSDDDEEGRDEQEGYDSEAGEKRKGGNRGAGNGSRAFKRTRYAGSFHDDNDDDIDESRSSGQDDNDTIEQIHSNVSSADSRMKRAQRFNTRDAEQEQDVPQADEDHTKTTSVRADSNPPLPSVRPLTAASLAATRLATRKTGVIYISRIPPYMKPSKVRSLLSAYGAIDRIFLTPEDRQRHNSRVKGGGNKKKRYIDGWVEFVDKRDAKMVAETLNANIIGGKKGGYYHDDVWNLKYLRGFKWSHLTEQIANENAERAARLRSEIAKSRKEDRQFVRNVERAKTLEGIKRKRALKKGRVGKDGMQEGGNEIEEKSSRRPVLFQQKVEIGGGRDSREVDGGEQIGDVTQSESVRRVLSKVF